MHTQSCGSSVMRGGCKCKTRACHSGESTVVVCWINEKIKGAESNCIAVVVPRARSGETRNDAQQQYVQAARSVNVPLRGAGKCSANENDSGLLSY